MASTTTKAPALKIPSKEQMQQRFHELQDEINAHEAKTAPKRQKREELIAKHEKEIRALEAEVAKMDGDVKLFDMKMELGDLVRLLKGHTGESPADRDARLKEEAKQSAEPAKAVSE